ncbi:MAG: DUF177 domain-containing protein [Nitrospira sp.]|nr:DUF177 domain-containing protein [Nitrospira sp.]
MIGEIDALGWGGGISSRGLMGVLTPKIVDITDEGLSLSGDLTGDELGLTDADVSIRGTMSVGLELRPIERSIYVTGVVEGTAGRQCVRCLKEFDEPVAFSLRVVYEREVKSTGPTGKRDGARKKKAVVSPTAEEEEPNDDLYYFTGDHLDLAPMLREQVILASPMHPLCTNDCLGLCARCGHDLNGGPCRCGDVPVGGPFDVLRTMKEKLRDVGQR